MSSVASSEAEASHDRRRAINDINDRMRELAVQMTVLNLKAAEQVGARDVDLKCLDILMRDGAQSASALARRIGLHPATMTGVLDRLEKGGWVVRERDPEDRRSTVVKAVHQRTSEIVREYTPMVVLMNELLENYDAGELTTIADFMRRITEAGQTANARIGELDQPGGIGGS
jgi:DNA-binding MarR family transcriptional regulator